MITQRRQKPIDFFPVDWPPLITAVEILGRHAALASLWNDRQTNSFLAARRAVGGDSHFAHDLPFGDGGRDNRDEGSDSAARRLLTIEILARQ
jgi:hypothetical protein